jgi:hypothetical protein
VRDRPRPSRTRHRVGGRARRAVDWWPWGWSAAALLWAWVTYRAAELELPLAVVATTALTAGAAYTVGYLIGDRS